MSADKLAIIVFSQDAELTRAVEGVCENQASACTAVFEADSSRRLIEELKAGRHICAIADFDANREVVDFLAADAPQVRLPVLFLADDERALNVRPGNSFGLYDIVLRPWVTKHTLPKFIASCVHNHALRFKSRQVSESARVNLQLLALISHEIKVPLETLRATQSTLLKLHLNDQAKLLATQSERAIAYMCEYIENFIEHARLEKGDLRSLEEEFCVQKLVREIIDLVWPKAHIKGVPIRFMAPPGDHVYAYGDKKSLRQILINMLSNAVRYTDEGAVAISVATENGLQFDIADTGVGMSADRQTEVFCSDVESVISSNGCADAGGLGIGVALSRKLVRLVNGEIAVESEEGAGTTISVRVPYKISAKIAKKVRRANEVNDLVI